jgi:hypothetical protein
MEIIIAFALVVQLDGDPEERVASHWLRLQHCLSDARLLSRREDNYAPVKALCKPVWVDPSAVEIKGYEGQVNGAQ